MYWISDINSSFRKVGSWCKSFLWVSFGRDSRPTSQDVEKLRNIFRENFVGESVSWELHLGCWSRYDFPIFLSFSFFFYSILRQWVRLSLSFIFGVMCFMCFQWFPYVIYVMKTCTLKENELIWLIFLMLWWIEYELPIDFMSLID